MKMKIYILFATLVLISATAFSSQIQCPCPGPCCPNKDTSLIMMADYLSPWATTEKTNALIEQDLKKHVIQ